MHAFTIASKTNAGVAIMKSLFHNAVADVSAGNCRIALLASFANIGPHTFGRRHASSSSEPEKSKPATPATANAASTRFKSFAAPPREQLSNEEYVPEAERQPLDWSYIKWPPGEPPYKLKMLPKVPLPYMNQKPPKMMRMLSLMRGPERVQNQLLYDQFAIIALQGGRLTHSTMEMIRNGINKRINGNDCFAVWRIEPPWQPMTKKALGARGGGGKGSIHHYVTPVRYGRVIVEVGGKLSWQAAQFLLDDIAERLPFRAMAVNKEAMQERLDNRLHLEHDNMNPLNMKYFILNNLRGCNYKVMNEYDWETWGEFR